MEKDKFMRSMARLALIAAGGTAAAVVTFTGGITSPAATAHQESTPVAGAAAQRYVTSLTAFQVAAEPIQYTQVAPFSLIFGQLPPDGGAPFGQV
jgi:hypothetical protein